MKKFPFIVALVAMLFSFSVAKADIYTESLTKMFTSGVLSGVDMESIVKQSGNQVDVNSLIPKMAEAMAPYYRENMSEAEMKQLVDYYTSPEIVASAKKIVQEANNTQGAMMKDLGPALMQIMQGQTPAKPKPVEVDAAYKAAFDRYLEVNNVNENIKATFDGLTGVLKMSMPSQNAEQEEQITSMFARLSSFMSENMGTVLLNAFHDKVTIDDLNTYNKIAELPFYEGSKKATTAMIKDLPNFIKKMETIMR